MTRDDLFLALSFVALSLALGACAELLSGVRLGLYVVVTLPARLHAPAEQTEQGQEADPDPAPVAPSDSPASPSPVSPQGRKEGRS